MATFTFAKNLIRQLKIKFGIGLGLKAGGELGPVKGDIGAKATLTGEVGADSSLMHHVTFSAEATGTAGPVQFGPKAESDTFGGLDSSGKFVSGEKNETTWGNPKLTKEMHVKETTVGDGDATPEGDVGVSRTLVVVEGGIKTNFIKAYNDTVKDLSNLDTDPNYLSYGKQVQPAPQQKKPKLDKPEITSKDVSNENNGNSND